MPPRKAKQIAETSSRLSQPTSSSTSNKNNIKRPHDNNQNQSTLPDTTTSSKMTPSRPVQSRQRRRDQQEFLHSVESAATNILESQQTNLAQHQLPLQHDNNAEKNSHKEVGDANTDSGPRDFFVPIPPLPTSMKTPSAGVPSPLKSSLATKDTSDNHQKESKSSSASPRRVTITLSALQDEDNNDNNVGVEQKTDVPKKKPEIPTISQDSPPRFLQSTGNKRKRKSTSPKKVGDQNESDDEDDDDDTNANNFVTIQVPSPWNRGWIAKRVRASNSAKSMNTYAAEDFHRTATSNNNNSNSSSSFMSNNNNNSTNAKAEVTRDYARLMSSGISAKQRNEILNNTHASQTSFSLARRRQSTTARCGYEEDEVVEFTPRSRGLARSSNKNNKNAEDDALLKRNAELMNESVIGTDRDDADGGEAIFGKRLVGPLLVIRRFDALEDGNNATLLDINMDGNSKCISSRRPIPGVTGMLPTGTMIAASKTYSSFGEIVDGGGPEKANRALTERRQVLDSQRRNSLQPLMLHPPSLLSSNKNQSSPRQSKSETIAEARSLLLSGLNPYLGAGSVSESARDNSGAEYEMLQAELQRDPFAVRKRKRMEKIQKSAHQTSAGGRATPPSTFVYTGRGITERSAYDTLDVRQSRIHNELSDLLKSAKQKTQTTGYLVPAAHKACQ